MLRYLGEIGLRPGAHVDSGREGAARRPGHGRVDGRHAISLELARMDHASCRRDRSAAAASALDVAMRVTNVLVAINVIAYIWEVATGALNTDAALMAHGALYGPAVVSGAVVAHRHGGVPARRHAAHRRSTCSRSTKSARIVER